MIRWALAVMGLALLGWSAFVLHSASRPRLAFAPSQARSAPPRAQASVDSRPAEASNVRQQPSVHHPDQFVSRAAPNPLAPLAVRLLGTMMAGDDSAHSLAILEDGLTGDRRFYKQGDMIQGRRLSAIARAHVLLRAGDHEERIELEPGPVSSESAQADLPAPDERPLWQGLLEHAFRPATPLTEHDTEAVKAAIRPLSETERVVDRDAAWGALRNNPFQLASEAEIEPLIESGRLAGFQLRSVRDHGILRHSGFAADDVIRTVNGHPVTQPAAMLRLPFELPQTTEVDVLVERNGKPVTLRYYMQ